MKKWTKLLEKKIKYEKMDKNWGKSKLNRKKWTKPEGNQNKTWKKWLKQK